MTFMDTADGPPPRLGVVLAVLLAAQFMVNVDTAIVNVAVPDITVRLRASGGDIQLVVAGYVLTYAVLLITGARLGDMRGHRRVFLFGTAVFTAASLACGLAPTAGALIGARLAQGVGAALMVPQVLTGIQLHFPGRARVRALAWYAVALSGGAVAGQVLGGVLVAADLWGWGWRPIFLINLPVGLVLLAAAALVLPADTRTSSEKLDLAGVGTLSASLVTLVVPLVSGRDQGWPPWAWICLAVSPVLMAAFVVVERRTAARGGYPLVNLPVIGRPVISWGLAAQGCAQASYFAVLLTLALYLQQGLGASALFSGLALVSWVAAFGIAGYALRTAPGTLASRIGPYGYGLLTLTYAAIALCLFTGLLSTVVLVVLLGVGGLGLGLGINSMIVRIAAAVPPRFAADISGVHSTVLQVAGVLGVAVFGSLYFGTVPEPGPAASARGFAVALCALAGSALAATFAAWRSTRSPADAGTPPVAVTTGKVRSP
jgi:MFS family permease